MCPILARESLVLHVSCGLCSVAFPLISSLASSSSDAQPMGRADTRNPLAQLSSLTSLSPVAPFLSGHHLFLHIAIVPHFSRATISFSKLRRRDAKVLAAKDRPRAAPGMAFRGL